MSEYLPASVREGLRAAQKAAARRKSRLRVVHESGEVKVLRLWSTGFSVDVEDAPTLRGFVDLYDGARHLYRCLVITSHEEGEEWVYEFKRQTASTERAPLDFVLAEDAPAGLLPRH